MVDAQKWLDENYPKWKRESITKIIAEGKNLVGNLDLGDFTNLELIQVRSNKLTSIDLSKNLKLDYLQLFDNPIKSVKYNLANQILARNVVIINRLTHGKNEKLENEILKAAKEGFQNCGDIYTSTIEKNEEKIKQIINKALAGKQEIINIIGLPFSKREFFSQLLNEKERQTSQLTNQLAQSQTKISILTRKKETIQEQVNEQLKNKETALTATFQKEKSQLQQTLANHQTKIQQLETQLANFEKQKQEALTQQKDQIWSQVQQQDDNLRNKVNSKLENRLFAPSEKGQTLTRAIDNLLEKQNRLTNQINELESEIGRTNLELSREKENYAKEKTRLTGIINTNLPYSKKGKNLDEAVNNLVRAYLTVQTGGTSGAVAVANSLLNQGHGPSLPTQAGHFSPPMPTNNPVNLLSPNTNPQPVINHHYHARLYNLATWEINQGLNPRLEGKNETTSR
ncbi:6923_t:CDS:2 [Cetraspora pellucida]|uniref:6923_t:CDS:1 n=1 Tax=Cetraspora pellucida TaxID=1433469 RepID=A0A9N9NSZ9_9GLOM|nr:6923_t:CDS:2 [Cetraspora pellucida]